MIPPVTHQSVRTPFSIANPSAEALNPNFQSLSFPEKLKSIGLFDDQYHLLFTPSKIPHISETGQIRFKELMNKQVHCPTTDSETDVILKESEYISGLKATLKEKGIETKTYLRGSYATYVACLADYFEFLIHEFLASKKLPKNLFIKELNALKNSHEVAPHDVDLFDQVVNCNMKAQHLSDYSMEYFRSLTKEKIKFLQKLIPEVCPLFPYPEDYVLFTIGTKEFQTDRIIGKLHHEYLYTRDDIRIEIKDGKVGIPESAGNFWQMVIDRKFKIVRTESWHEKDFRAGLAAIQLIHHDHLLIEDGCTIESIIRYAVSTGSDKILTGAIDRARLHCKNSFGFLLNVLIAYTHAKPDADLEILKDAIGEIPPLASLYKLALLMTLYTSDTARAFWDPSGLLILYWNDHRIIFPKSFAVTSTEKPFYKIDSWVRNPFSQLDPVYKVLEGDLSGLERVLFELALQKPLTPLTESMKDALVEYLIETNSAVLATLLHPWLEVKPDYPGWVKALTGYSVKHGLRLWNGIKDKMEAKVRATTLEAMIGLLAPKRPNQAYALLDEKWIPKDLRLKLLKIIAKSTAIRGKIIDELIEERSLDDIGPLLIHAIENDSVEESYLLWTKLKPFISPSPSQLLAIDRIITERDEEWFFNSNPSQERIEAFYQKSKNLNVLIKGITLPILQKYKNEIKSDPETYIKLIKQFCSESLAKEWIESFPQNERWNQTLIFFTEYVPTYHPLLDSICSLPGIHENKLIEILHLEHKPVFAERPNSKLLKFLSANIPETKNELLKILGQASLSSSESDSLQGWMKANHAQSLDFVSYLLEEKAHLSIARKHLIYLKKTKNSLSNDPLFATHWIKVLDHLPISSELIPFYQDRQWVQSVYGPEAETKTKEWGDALIKQGNLEKLELTAIENILSRNTLIHTPRARLKDFLESIYNEKLTEDMLDTYYKGILSTLFIKIPLDDKLQNHHLQLIFTLFKLGIGAKLHTVEGLTPLKAVLTYIPFIYQNEKYFDPLIQLMQTLPLVDYGSSPFYHEQNLVRYDFVRSWADTFESNEPYGRQLRDYKIPSLPYPAMKAACDISHQFKLITEQYIENKATKEAFQIEVLELSKSAVQIFKSEELKPHEDPCLICINDFSHLLKYQNKRTRAYEAFYYLLKQQPKSPSILNQQNYLEVRQKTEDMLLAKAKLLETNKIVFSQFFKHFGLHLNSLFGSAKLQNLHIQDPILDALENESISLFYKIELKHAYCSVLPLNTPLLFTPYVVNNLTSNLAFDLQQVNEKELEAHLMNRIASLKKLKKSLNQEMLTAEINLIFNRAFISLPREKTEKLIKYFEKTLSMNVPYTFTEK